METQYSLMKAIIDGHNHDDEIDTKAIADATFYHSSHMGLNSGMDADLIDGQSYSDILSAILPIGSIIWFKGTDAQIPTGWHIMDGSGGLSDYRDRFIIGAGSAYVVGATGGPATWNGTISPTGTVTIGDHQLTTAELPEHTHTYIDYDAPLWASNMPNPGGSSYCSARAYISREIGEQSEGNGTHGHPGSTASLAAIDPRPPYYALFLIKKVS